MIDTLPRREREIFEILCSAGEATAAAVRERMTSPPSDSAVCTLLARLERRGLVRHRVAEQTYVYASVPAAAQVRDSALRQVVKNFFDGSAVSAATAMLGLTRGMKEDELKALHRAIDQATERKS